jgi:AcrR family transcriptional regulator
LELYRERGFDRTTTAEIAARAKVTERTFFRHFPDKREVLFEGEAGMIDALTASILDAPAKLSPMDVLLRAFRSFEQTIVNNRPINEPRQKIIAATPALLERAHTKAATVTAALAAALQKRGVERKLALLTARTGMAAFDHAALCWLEDPKTGLDDHLKRAFRTLRGLSKG